MSDILSLIGELGVLSDDRYRLFVSLWSVRGNSDSINSIVIGKEPEFSKIFIKLLTSLHVETVRNEMFELVTNVCKRNKNFGKVLSEEPDTSSFLQQSLLNASGPHSLCVAYILLHKKGPETSQGTSQYLKYVLNIFEQAPKDIRTFETRVAEAFHTLSVFLRRKELRDAFRLAGGLSHIPSFIKLYGSDLNLNTQLLYDCLFSSWVSLYHPDGLDILYKKKMIAIVHDVLKRCTKEKCIRISIVILQTMIYFQKRFFDGDDPVYCSDPILANMNNGRGPRFSTDMVGVGLIKTLASLRKRTYGDEDILPSIENLEETLQNNVDELTVFSEYVGEVQSGTLEWSPPHTSTKFWKENLKNIENNEFEILRELSALLFTSKHDPTLAIACHDFGEVVRHHPHGRKILSLPILSGVKEKIMELMSSSNQEVSRHSLLALQKIMVQRWEFLDRAN